jgi:hypothetical protein
VAVALAATLGAVSKELVALSRAAQERLGIPWKCGKRQAGTLSRNPEWLTQVQEVRVNTSMPALGTQITEVRRVPGRSIEGIVEITEWQPARRLRKTSPSGGLRADGVYELTPAANGGTHLAFWLEIRAAGILKVMEWLLGIRLQKDTKQVLRNLKEALSWVHRGEPPHVPLAPLVCDLRCLTFNNVAVYDSETHQQF